MISVILFLDSSKVKAKLIFRAFGVNLLATLNLNELIYLFVRSEFHLDS